MKATEEQRSHAETVAKELIQKLGAAGAVSYAKRALKSLLDLNATGEMMYGWAVIMVAIVEETQEA